MLIIVIQCERLNLFLDLVYLLVGALMVYIFYSPAQRTVHSKDTTQTHNIIRKVESKQSTLSSLADAPIMKSFKHPSAGYACDRRQSLLSLLKPSIPFTRRSRSLCRSGLAPHGRTLGRAHILKHMGLSIKGSPYSRWAQRNSSCEVPRNLGGEVPDRREWGA